MTNTTVRIQPGFHILQDTATRTSVVGYVDDQQRLWLPGSEKSFPTTQILVTTGDDSRFNQVSKIDMPASACGSWDVEAGRID